MSKDIIKLKMCDQSKYEQDDYYYIRKDKNFEEKLEGLKALTKTYSSYEEIEDYIFNNFEVINLDFDTYKIYY